jgi:hypothetical protein
MIMRRPDCQLNEYLEEIHNRYGFTVSKGRLSDILKELGITHKKVCSCVVCDLWANSSWQKRLYSEMKSSGMLGFERLQNGGLSKSFSLMNRASILVLENELMDGAQKDASFHIQFIFRVIPILASSQQ